MVLAAPRGGARAERRTMEALFVGPAMFQYQDIGGSANRGISVPAPRAGRVTPLSRIGRPLSALFGYFLSRERK